MLSLLNHFSEFKLPLILTQSSSAKDYLGINNPPNDPLCVQMLLKLFLVVKDLDYNYLDFTVSGYLQILTDLPKLSKFPFLVDNT